MEFIHNWFTERMNKMHTKDLTPPKTTTGLPSKESNQLLWIQIFFKWFFIYFGIKYKGQKQKTSGKVTGNIDSLLQL